METAGMSRDAKIKLAEQLLNEVKNGAGGLGYPAKAGEYVLLPADEHGKRRVVIVPASEIAQANLFGVQGVQKFTGEVPKEGYVLDSRTSVEYSVQQSQKTAEKVEAPASSEKMPADFATNKAPILNAQERISAITAAILGLSADDFNSTNGYPKVPSLNKVLGFDIETKERDSAWEAFKKSQPNWAPKAAE